jgi:hypothetical protein
MIKWPVVVMTPGGLVDGHTHNLSLGGALIRIPNSRDVEDNFRLVMTSKERLVMVAAERVWADEYGSSDKLRQQRMGIRFTSISSDDRQFIHHAISSQR